MGEHDRAKEWLARALAIDPDDNNAIYNAACTYALLGERDRAVELLEGWCENAGGEYLGWFTNDSDLDSIRDHPGYAALLTKVARSIKV